MRILVFQHSQTVHPGVYRDMMRADGAQVTTVDFERGDTIPCLGGFDALWVMGGPMDVWQEDEHPWLAGEKRAIREAVRERGMGYFGLCLGHQLLAAACGGEVAPAGTSEIGVMTIDLNREGAGSAWFAGVESGFPALQWHYSEVVRPPEDARVLAHSPACAVQAMTLGPRVLSLQFHLEATRETVNDWRAIPGTDELLVEAMGENGAELFTNAFISREDEAHAVARKVYANWRNAILAAVAA
ncbi:MAG: type 1 glutamine amidotransferase [Rhodobiaceae bacterium]|nr:type 1 glutamine amidotransferase [Rhodobiaceae bacterium]